MSDLIAIVVAALPFLVFLVLVIETFRSNPSAGDGQPVDLFRRSFGA